MVITGEQERNGVGLGTSTNGSSNILLAMAKGLIAG